MTIVKVAKDLGIIGISRILVSISAIILIPILTKNLGAEGYGIWAQVVATVAVFLPILFLGLPISMTRFFPTRKNKKQISKDFYSIFLLVFLVSGIFTCILLLFPKFLADLIFNGNIIIVQLLALIIFVWCIDRLFLSVFRAFRNMKTHAILEVSTKYLEIILAAFLVILGYGIIGAIIALLVIRTGLFILLVFLIIRKIPISKPSFHYTKEYLIFSLPTIPHNISNWIVSASDRYLIGIFLSTKFVGYYTSAYEIGLTIPFMISGVLGFVLPSSLSKYYEERKNRNNKQDFGIVYKKISFIISIPHFIGILILYHPILSFVTTDEIAFEGGFIAIFTAFVGLLWGPYMVFINILFLKKKTKLMSSIWIIAATINIIGNIILIPILGILGAAIATIVAYVFSTGITLLFSLKEKEFKLSVDLNSFGKIIIASILMGIVVYLLKVYLISNLFLLIGIGLFAYLAMLFLLGGIKKNEISMFKNLLK